MNVQNLFLSLWFSSFYITQWLSWGATAIPGQGQSTLLGADQTALGLIEGNCEKEKVAFVARLRPSRCREDAVLPAKMNRID